MTVCQSTKYWPSHSSDILMLMTNPGHDIYKAAAVIIEDRKIVTTRSRGKDIYVQPGGKLERKPDGQMETEREALARELWEELGISIADGDVTYMDTFYDEAAGQPGRQLKMAVYVVRHYAGVMTPNSEIEEIRLFGSDIPEGVTVGSIMLHRILPRLKAQELID